MAALLATGTTLANSADFTLSGEASTLFLVSTASLPVGASAEIQIKGANGVYYPFGSLSAAVNPVQVLSSPGTYRVARTATGVDVGVDRV